MKTTTPPASESAAEIDQRPAYSAFRRGEDITLRIPSHDGFAATSACHVLESEVAERVARELVQAIGPLAPSLTPESAGWWWLQVGGDWCACTIEFVPPNEVWNETTPEIDTRFLRPKGGLSGHRFKTEEEIRAEVWGGRILGPVQP